MAPSEDAGDRRRRLLAALSPSRLGGRLGLAVVALGLLVIGIGWDGAAGSGGEIDHVPVVQAQLPWLLSGGFLGLGIVVLGAALIIANAQREGQRRLRDSLEAMTDAVERLGATGVLPDDLGGLVVAGSESYHTTTCRLVQDRSDTRLLTLEQVAAEGLTPCRICRPPQPAPVP
jgi:S1-C subfamily serine protease